MPLQRLIALGYSQVEVQSLDPQALQLIVDSQLRRPQRGISPAWKQEQEQDDAAKGPPLIQIMENAEQAQAFLEQSKIKTKRQPEPEQLDEPPPPRSQRKPKIDPRERQLKEGVGRVTQPTSPSLRTKSSREPSSKVAEESVMGPEIQTRENETPQFAIYKVGLSSAYQKVPMELLFQLGYQVEDIQMLKSEVLDFIVAEKTPKPQGGVPPRWKTDATGNEFDDDTTVRVLGSIEAAEYVKAQGAELSPTTTTNVFDSSNTQQRKQQSRDEEIDQPPKRRRPRRPEIEDELSEAARSPRRKPRRDPREMDDEYADRSDRRRRQSRSSYQDDGRRKPIYTGRQPQTATSKLDRRPDPPKPEAFWPDITTFRNLLRDEASLRLNILGDDWADIVKQESDWRLKLYKDWLWTLHDGIGNPIVESRSDRARKYRVRQPSQQSLSSSSRGLTPRSQKKKKKKPRRQARNYD